MINTYSKWWKSRDSICSPYLKMNAKRPATQAYSIGITWTVIVMSYQGIQDTFERWSGDFLARKTKLSGIKVTFVVMETIHFYSLWLSSVALGIQYMAVVASVIWWQRRRMSARRVMLRPFHSPTWTSPISVQYPQHCSLLIVRHSNTIVLTA